MTPEDPSQLAWAIVPLQLPTLVQNQQRKMHLKTHEIAMMFM
jgi:hypothetical protein